MPRLPAALIVLALSASSAIAQHASPGWSYTMNITADSGDAAHRGSMAMRYRTTADHLRSDIVQVSGAAMPSTGGGVDIEGMYTLVNDADSTLIQVLPNQHAAMIMTNPLFSMAKPTLSRVAVEPGATSKTEDLGAGGRILGHATRHFRTTSSGSMTMTIGGSACSYPLDAVTESWIAPDVDILPAMRSMVAHYGASAPDISTTPSSMKSPMHGLALRSISHTNVTLPSGEQRPITTTIEYTEISQGPIDDAVFAIPAEFKQMDMRAMMAQIPQGMLDSVAAARPQPANCLRP